jgi:hypothetical protein
MALTAKQKNAVKAINKQIAALQAARLEALTSGVSSATLSSAGNSQSFTRLKPTDFDQAISRLNLQKRAILNGGSLVRTIGPNFS